MPKATWIPVRTFCVHHHIEFSLIHTLHGYGMVEILKRKEEYFIPAQQLNELERFIRLYRDLDINPEGIDAIIHLLRKMVNMQDRITLLQNRLSRYEPVK